LSEPGISPERLTALVEAAEHIHGVWSGISPEARMEVARQWQKALHGIPAPFVERAFEEWSGKRAPKPRELAEAATTLRQVAVNAVCMSSMPAPAPEPEPDAEPARGERMTAAEMLASVREKLREGDSAILRGMEARLSAEVEAGNGEA
jgi:hypothetical protein